MALSERPEPAGRWSLDFATAWEAVAAPEVQQLWRRLLAEDPDPHPFKEPALALAWAETCGRAIGAVPRVGRAVHSTGARALLPWTIVRHRGRSINRKVLEPIGQSLFGYQDPVADAAAAALSTAGWAGLWQAARRALSGGCDQALLRLVQPRYAHGPHAEPAREESPVLSLAGIASFEELLAGTSANQRGDVRRRLRRLAERGAIALDVAGPADARRATAEFRERFVPAYRAVWEGEPAGCLLDQPGLADFLHRILEVGLPAGWAHFVTLTVDGEPVAWHLGLARPNRPAAPGEIYWWFPTYAPEWAALSPGKVLLAKLLEHAVGTGLGRLHFLTGAQPYKLAWRPEPHALRTVRWHSPSIRGRLLSLYDRTRSS
jgi:CelD/BcsL family acetyltransferase involved in cellulose biosynthesis